MPPLDLGLAALLAAFGLVVCGLFPLTILLEAAILWVMKWSKFVTSLLTSIAMNIVAAFFLVVTVLSPLVTKLGEGIAMFFVIWLAISLLVDGTIMTFMRRQSLGKSWFAAAAANVGSSGLLVLIWLVSNSLSVGTP